MIVFECFSEHTYILRFPRDAALAAATLRIVQAWLNTDVAPPQEVYRVMARLAHLVYDLNGSASYHEGEGLSPGAIIIATPADMLRKATE